jgi:hypothetical protein
MPNSKSEIASIKHYASENCVFDKAYVIGRVCTENPSININNAEDPGSSVSCNHLQVTFRKDLIELKDYKNNQGSYNGTWVRFKEGRFLEGKLILRIGLCTYLKMTKPKMSMDEVNSISPFSFISDYSFVTEGPKGIEVSYYHPNYYQVFSEQITENKNLINIALLLTNSEMMAVQIIKEYNEMEKLNGFAGYLEALAATYKNGEYVKCVYIFKQKNFEATVQYLKYNPTPKQ